MSFFEDFEIGQRMRHARGTTVGEVENQLLTKLVMNTADAHYNEHKMRGTPFGQRLVFGLVTGSIVIGLATQDTAEHAIAELRLDKLRFRAPVFHGDTVRSRTTVKEIILPILAGNEPKPLVRDHVRDLACHRRLRSAARSRCQRVSATRPWFTAC